MRSLRAASTEATPHDASRCDVSSQYEQGSWCGRASFVRCYRHGAAATAKVLKGAWMAQAGEKFSQLLFSVLGHVLEGVMAREVSVDYAGVSGRPSPVRWHPCLNDAQPCAVGLRQRGRQKHSARVASDHRQHTVHGRHRPRQRG